MKNKAYLLAALYHFLINYIAVDDIDYKDEEDIFLNEHFLEVLLYILSSEEYCREDYNFFTEEMYTRIGKLIEYIKNNMKSDIINQIINVYNKNKRNYSNDFYNNEFMIKYNFIVQDMKDKAFIWNKKEIEESVKKDYFMFLILQLKEKEFYETFKEEYVGDIDYLLFVNKLLNTFPNLLLDKKIKNKILFTLTYNYSTDNNDMFYKIKDSLYEKLVKTNKINTKNRFTHVTFETLYFNVIFEKMVVLNEEYDIDYTNEFILEKFYVLIDYYTSKDMCNKAMQSRIINILDKFKNNIKNIDINRYNNYLVKVNSIIPNETNFKYNYLLRIGLDATIQSLFKPYMIDEYLELINLDLVFLESLLCDKEYDEKYLKNFIYYDDYVVIVKKYLKEYPLLFSDKNVYDKVIKTLKAIMKEYESGNLNSKDHYLQNKKTLKRLEKGKF